ncbi:MAG TPA: peptide deformylase [Anaerolineaceae bacterium]
MAIREIVFVPDPVLRRKAHKVVQFDQALQTLVDDMVETMRQAPGVGLAAPQVGVSQRLIVVEYGKEDTEGNEIEGTKKLYIIANPEITEASADTVSGPEGCLSVPGINGEVNRSIKVTVKGLNRAGKPVKVKAEGWLARIFQHEIDHLDGIVFTDRATRIWKLKEGEPVKDRV